MPKPPLRKGLDPLVQILLIKIPLSRENDRFIDFFLFFRDALPRELGAEEPAKEMQS